jgi:hypothetical protein
VGQQLHQAGLANLGQVVNGARAGLPAEQQPSVSVGEDERLDGVGAGLAGDEPMSAGPAGRRAAHADLGGIQQAELSAGAQMGDHIAKVRSRTPPSTVQSGSASSGRTSPIARVIVERDTPNQQARTSWVTPWRRCTRVAKSRSMNTSRCRAPAPTARRRG